MKFKSDNKYVRWGLTAFLVIAASICFYYLMFHSSNIKSGMGNIINILMPIVFGLVTAYLLTPVLNYLEYKVMIPLCNKCKMKESAKRDRIIRGIGIVATAFLFFFLIYSLFAMLLSQIVPSIQSIISNFDTYINNFTKWLNDLFANNLEIKNYAIKMVNKYSEELELWLNTSLLTTSSELIKTVSMSVISILKVVWNFIIGFVISIYFLASKEKFAGQAKKCMYAVLQKKTANVFINNLRFTHKTFIGFIGGKILDSIIIGILCFIGTSIMNTPYAVLVSVIIGVTNVIPFFGPYIGAIPTTILIFVVDPGHPLNCVYFVLFILVLQQFDGNVLGPKILGNSTGITGFWVIFAITLFGGLFGVLGMIVGVPIFAVLYAAIKSFVNAALRKRKMPQETEEYMDVGAVDEDGFHTYIPEYRTQNGKSDKHNKIKKARYGSHFLSSSDELIFEADTEESLGDEEIKEEKDNEI